MNTGMFETLSDCWHSHNSWDGANRLYYSGAYTAANEDNSTADVRYNFTADQTWAAIRSGWLFIENVGRVPDMDNEEKARLTAEAKVLIASRYFDMFRHLADCHWWTKPTKYKQNMRYLVLLLLQPLNL